MSNIRVFNFEESNIRTVTRDGEPWFVAKDVCDVLAITNVSLAVNGRERTKEDGTRYWSGGLDTDEKGIVSVNTPGGTQGLLCVSESGVYALVFQSTKPEAKAFQRWVRHEVLPSIRETGSYAVEQFKLPTTYLEALEAHLQSERKRMEVEAQLQEQDELLRLQAPKVALYDVAMQAHNSQPIGTVAKTLGVGPNKLFIFLRERKILISHGSRFNLPYQEFIDRGYFEVRQYTITHLTSGVENKTQTLITAKGVAFIHKLLQDVKQAVGV